MHIIILDDESLYRKSIGHMIRHWALTNNHNDSIVISEFHSSEDLMEAWANGFRIDLMFLDIVIPNEMDGIQLAKEIVTKDKNIQIVYITNHSDYALLGYEVNALRFIMKPVTQERIDACLDIAWNKWQLSQNTFIRAQGVGSVFVFAAQDLAYAESSGHCVLLHFFDNRGDMEIRESMSLFQKKLPVQLFIRCHRSFVINIQYVRKVKSDALTLSNFTTLPIGRKYLKQVRQAFDHYYQGDIKLDQYL